MTEYITTRDFVQACRDAMITADVILPGRLVRHRPPTVKDIAWEVAQEHGLSLDDIRNGSRAFRFSHPRQEAMRRAHEAGYSLPQIARFWGYDHTTVLHGVRAAQKRLHRA